MEAIKYKVVNSAGEEVGSIDLDPEIFGAPINEAVTFDAVRWQLDKRRAGNHSVLTKGVMRGGNRKPWRQKGTGRARSGSNTSPLWVGGGVAHGPKVHDYLSRVSKRTRKQALISVLSDKVAQSKLVVLDKLEIAGGKTKEMAKVLRSVGANGGVALLLAGQQKDFVELPAARAARNIERLQIFPVGAASAYELLRLDYLVSTVADLGALQESLKSKTKAASK